MDGERFGRQVGLPDPPGPEILRLNSHIVFRTASSSVSRQRVEYLDLVGSPLTHDLPCVQCGYNLRGLDPASRCPECGAAISRSRQGDLLRNANPAWLARIKLGADVMFIGIMAKIGGSLILGCLAGIQTAVSFALFPILGALSAALMLAAVYLITTQEPRVSLSEGELTWRKAIRALAVAHFVLRIGAEAYGWVGSTLSVIGMIGAPVLGLIIVFGFFSYAETFAVRVPDKKLAGSTLTVKWGLTICGALTSLGPLGFGLVLGLSAGIVGAPPGTVVTTTMPATPVVPPALRSTSTFALGGIVALVGIAWLIFSIWALILLSRYRRVLRLAISEARVAHEISAPLGSDETP